MDPDAIRTAFNKHRTTPHISTEEYVRDCQIKLGESVVARERVYLDKRYWIILRDSIMGRNLDTSVKAVLTGLRARVKSKRSICPISETVFIELLKQTDVETRRATAILIDELSEGVALLPHPERVATEFAHFLHSQANVKVYPLEALVWSKLSYVLGVQYPKILYYPDSEHSTMQKAFFDHMWQFSLTEIIDILGNARFPHFDFDALAVRLNEESSKSASAISSFHQVYKAEIRGSLTLFMHVAREVLEDISSRASGTNILSSVAEKSEHERMLLQYFCKEVTKKSVAISLRTLHIGAVCHASIRWDKRRKMMGNDLYDFHHAEAAVGYCDVFLTEQPLKTLLEQRHLNLHKYFLCRIISSPVEAAKWLETA